MVPAALQRWAGAWGKLETREGFSGLPDGRDSGDFYTVMYLVHQVPSCPESQLLVVGTEHLLSRSGSGPSAVLLALAQTCVCLTLGPRSPCWPVWPQRLDGLGCGILCPWF